MDITKTLHVDGNWKLVRGKGMSDSKTYIYIIHTDCRTLNMYRYGTVQF